MIQNPISDMKQIYKVIYYLFSYLSKIVTNFYQLFIVQCLFDSKGGNCLYLIQFIFRVD